MYATLFDIDGTLIQTGGAGQQAFAEAFAELFGVDRLSSRISFSGRSDRAIAMDLMVEHGVDPSIENWHRFKDSYVARLPDALESRVGRVLEGAAALIERLQQREHVIVGLLTGNIRRGAQAKLQYYGLYEEFPFGGFGDDATDRNDIANAALRAAEVHARSRASFNGEPKLHGAMVIGDTIFDIRCARAIGAFSVAVPTGGVDAATLRSESPDLLLESLEDMEPILRTIERAVLPD